MSESVSFGGGGKGDFQAMQQRQQKRQNNRDELKHARLKVAKDKEAEKMAGFRAMMGLAPGQGFSIPKRQ